MTISENTRGYIGIAGFIAMILFIIFLVRYLSFAVLTRIDQSSNTPAFELAADKKSKQTAGWLTIVSAVVMILSFVLSSRK